MIKSNIQKNTVMVPNWGYEYKGSTLYVWGRVPHLVLVRAKLRGLRVVFKGVKAA